MKMKYQHPALRYHNPLTGEYDENESINKDGVIYVECKYEVCDQCNGHGVYTRKDIDDSKLVDSMIEDGDYDGIESYYRGAYDRQCEWCRGMRVIQQPIDFPKWADKLLDEWWRCEKAHAEYSRQERMMGA
jgi:hypothetical protein